MPGMRSSGLFGRPHSVAVGMHGYYARAWDIALLGMQNVPIGGQACMPGMRRWHRKIPVERWPPKAATSPRPLLGACTPWFRDVHADDVCMLIDYGI